MKKKLSCEVSLKNWKLKMWKRVEDVPQKLRVEDVKTKLSCGLSQNWKLKMWKRRFRARRPFKFESRSSKTKLRARHPSKTESWRCESEVFVRDVPPKWKVEVVKTKLSCEIIHPHLASSSSQLTLRSSHSHLHSPLRDHLTLSPTHSHLNWLSSSLTLRSSLCISTHSHLSSLWDHLTLISTHSEIISPSTQLTLRSSHPHLKWVSS